MIAICLVGLARVAERSRQPVRAARLFGAAEPFRDATRRVMDAIDVNLFTFICPSSFEPPAPVPRLTR